MRFCARVYSYSFSLKALFPPLQQYLSAKPAQCSPHILIGANWIHLLHDSGVTLNLGEKSILMPGLRDFNPVVREYWFLLKFI